MTLNNITVYYYEDNGIDYYKVTNLVQAIVVSNPAQVGDSGGPFFLEIDNDLYFCGVFSGGNDTYCNFTPYGIIHNNGPFTVAIVGE